MIKGLKSFEIQYNSILSIEFNSKKNLKEGIAD